METEHGERTQRGYAIEREAQDNREQAELARPGTRIAPPRAAAPTRSAAPNWTPAPPERRRKSATPKSSSRRLQQELETDRATLESANADVAGAQQELQQRQQEASAAAASLVEFEQQQEQRRSAILQAVSAASAVRNRITQAEERIAALERDAQRLNDETSTANQQLETFGGQRGQLGLEFESASQRVNALAAHITENSPATRREARGRNRRQAPPRFPARASMPA